MVNTPISQNRYMRTFAADSNNGPRRCRLRRDLARIRLIELSQPVRIGKPWRIHEC